MIILFIFTKFDDKCLDSFLGVGVGVVHSASYRKVIWNLLQCLFVYTQWHVYVFMSTLWSTLLCFTFDDIFCNVSCTCIVDLGLIFVQLWQKIFFHCHCHCHHHLKCMNVCMYNSHRCNLDIFIFCTGKFSGEQNLIMSQISWFWKSDKLVSMKWISIV